MAYLRIVLGTPTWLKAARRMFLSSQTTTLNTDEDEEIDDGIGFSNCKEESLDNQEASGLTKGAKAESNVPSNDR